MTPPGVESAQPGPERAARVFLIGPMGSGKSTVGRALASRLGFDFLDSDKVIEDRTGVDIPYIFEKEGEAGFRQREASIIEEVSMLPRLVLATGGGAILDAGTRQRLAARGTVVYLEATVEQQLRRTRGSTHRPLLQTEDPRGRLEQLMAVRAPLYQSLADLTVRTSRRKVACMVEDITAWLMANGRLS
ncbi:MAG: shikimate kinase AroK [Steroidobacteraceae bacterium]